MGLLDIEPQVISGDGRVAAWAVRPAFAEGDGVSHPAGLLVLVVLGDREVTMVFPVKQLLRAAIRAQEMTESDLTAEKTQSFVCS
jgi:hypothetical protein